MVEIRRSTIIEAPIESVWATLRDFNGHERWHPAVAASVIEEGAAGDAIGAVRNFRLADGARIREQLLALSDIETSFTYCILEAPVPLRNYVASVLLRRAARVGEGGIGVNFIDVYCRRGSFDLVTPPGVLGMEAAGIVENVGPGVSNVRIGDRVAYACAPPGAYASLRTMRADLLVGLPASLSEEAAAALLLKGVTASFLLHEVYPVKRGDFAVVHAAAGGVGQPRSPWARALGAAVVGV